MLSLTADSFSIQVCKLLAVCSPCGGKASHGLAAEPIDAALDIRPCLQSVHCRAM